MIPGPRLHFREGDRARVVAKNSLGDDETSIQWHGLLLPNAMDGVPFLTTEPIPPRGEHTFELDLRQSGTYWYHSHTGAVRRGIEVFELQVSLRARLADPLAFLGLAPVVDDGARAGLAGVEGRLFIDADADDAVLDELWRETLQRSPVAATLEGHVPLTIERRTH